MLSISTSWNQTPQTDMRQWLSQVKEMGFKAIELGYTLTQAQANEVKRMLQPMAMSVTSIHNFCPIPFDEPSPRHPSNHYRLSALDLSERQRAVQWTKKTIDLASEVGAAVVIIHAGTLELHDDPSKELIELYKQGKKESLEFQEAREKLKRLRLEKREPYLQALRSSLSEVMSYAHQKKVKIGLETRYYPIEIPNFEEIGYFLNLFGSQGMYYWHDVGHGEVSERLGLAKHVDFLKNYQDRLIGVHIHGINGLRDHLAPFDGDLDLNFVWPFLKEDTLRVIEARHATTAQIKEALTKLSFR